LRIILGDLEILISGKFSKIRQFNQRELGRFFMTTGTGGSQEKGLVGVGLTRSSSIIHSSIHPSIPQPKNSSLDAQLLAAI
jgi:hypothetical protein